ncbi:hypothetical protein FQN54_005130 [Arachnomyces sp. PD_36]|nr:hypothetical protein FQN54_005130 [Arachnomyces sp. PD_36]
MEEDPAWCSAEDSEEEEMELSSSLDSDKDSDQEEVHLSDKVPRRKEGDSSQTKKQVLLKLENSVIVPPSSSYEEPQVIDTSAIFAPRSPPLDDDEFSEMSYVPGNQGGYASDEESYCDSPPASLLKELSQTPELEQPAAAPQPAISGKATSPNTSQPRAIASKSADKVSDSDSATSSDKKKKTSRSAEAYFQERIEANRDAKFKAGPMDVPSTSDKVPRLHPRLGEKRESSSSLASEAPSLKQTRSDLSHNNVFLFDEEIHRYQGAGPDRDEEVLLMKSRDKKGKGKDSESDMDPYRKN